MKQITRALYRNRRRAAVSAMLFFIFGVLAQISGDQTIHLGKTFFVSTLLAIIMTVGLMLVVLIVPKWRAIMEISAGCAVLLRLWHMVTADIGLTLDPWVTIVMTWGACMLIGSLYAGPMLDRWLPQVPMTARGRARTPLDINTVWTGLYGLPEDRAQRYDRDDMIVYEPVDGQPHVYRVVERAEGLLQIEEHQRMELRDAPYNLRFEWWVPSAPDDMAFSRGTHSATLRETPKGGTEINVTYQTPKTSRRMAAFAWVDDHFGRATDEKLARLEALCRETHSVAVPAE